MAQWKSVVEDISSRCRLSGLDIIQPFSVEQRAGAGGPDLGLPDPEGACALGVLIGNTRELWPRFLASLEEEGGVIERDPLDCYVERAVVEALRPVPHRWRVRWAHDVGRGAVPMQRLAEASGLARLSPSKMCVHPVYGPWIALRAVALIEVDGSEIPETVAEDPCEKCEAPCEPLFDRAMAERDQTSEDWYRAWVAVRRSCPVGQSHVYGEEQLRYHYVKDASILRDLLRGRASAEAGDSAGSA